MNADEQIKQLTEERDAAQKACAEMRELLTVLRHQVTALPPKYTVWFHSALSTECGKDWRSPEDYAALEKKCADLQLTVDGLNVGYIHERELEPLVEALKSACPLLAEFEKRTLRGDLAERAHQSKVLVKHALAHWEKVKEEK